jgi:hypothetical protein
MRLIKLAIISFVILFIIITLFSLLIPSNVRISRAINIEAKQDKLLPLLKNKEQWREWNPVFMDDSAARNIQTKFVSVSDTLILSQWQQGNKQSITNGWHLHTIPNADSLTLQWYMDFNLPWYPWKKFESLFFDKVYGGMMQEGLQNIKRKVEE